MVAEALFKLTISNGALILVFHTLRFLILLLGIVPAPNVDFVSALFNGQHGLFGNVLIEKVLIGIGNAKLHSLGIFIQLEM